MKLTCAAIAVSATIFVSVPISAFAEDEQVAPTSSQVENSGTEGDEERERGVRIDGDFDASHPSEWIAIGIAIALAITLAYTARRRKRNRE